jgi:transposase-like protein
VTTCGILRRNGYEWAESVSGVEAATLLLFINKRVKSGSTVHSDTLRGYTGIAAHGYVHRVVGLGRDEFFDTTRIHINGLEGHKDIFRGIVPLKVVSERE